MTEANGELLPQVTYVLPPIHEQLADVGGTTKYRLACLAGSLLARGHALTTRLVAESTDMSESSLFREFDTLENLTQAGVEAYLLTLKERQITLVEYCFELQAHPSYDLEALLQPWAEAYMRLTDPAGGMRLKQVLAATAEKKPYLAETVESVKTQNRRYLSGTLGMILMKLGLPPVNDEVADHLQLIAEKLMASKELFAAIGEDPFAEPLHHHLVREVMKALVAAPSPAE